MAIFPFAADEAAVREPKDLIYGSGGRGDADIDVREDEERRESWWIFCAVKQKIAEEDTCASLEHPSAESPDVKNCFPGVSCVGFFMLHVDTETCVSAGGGFSITC